MSHKTLGHYVLRNVTSFQNCRSDDQFSTGEKPSQKHFDNSNGTKLCRVYVNPLLVGSPEICSKLCRVTVFPQLDAWASITTLCVACPASKGAQASI